MRHRARTPRADKPLPVQRERAEAAAERPPARPVLVRSDEAAVVLGLKPGASSFRSWAHRRGLKPARLKRVGRTTVALYDLDDVYRAEREARR